MEIRKKYQAGILLFLGSILSAFIAACIIPQFSDMMCVVLAGPFVITAVVTLILAFSYFLSEDEFIDRTYLDKPVKLRILPKFLWLLPLIILGYCAVQSVKPMVHLHNANIGYTSQYTKVQQERKLFYDKMWKTYLAKNEICEINRETFLEVTSIIMQGRSDGQSVSWKVVHENQQIPYEQFTSFYSDLSKFVTSQRESYYNLENKLMQVVQKQNNMLDSFPNNMYNRILKIEKLHYDYGFTSDRTEQVFAEKKENF